MGHSHRQARQSNEDYEEFVVNGTCELLMGRELIRVPGMFINHKRVIYSRSRLSRWTDGNGDLLLVLPIPNVGNVINIWFQSVLQQNLTNFVATQIMP